MYRYHYCIRLEHYTWKRSPMHDGIWESPTKILSAQDYEALKKALLDKYNTQCDNSTDIVIMSLNLLG